MPRAARVLLGLFALLPASLRGEGVVINEIHFDPPDKTRLEEFIELFNASAGATDLSGWYFSEGISFRIPAGTVLGPGEFLIVAESPEKFVASFGPARVVGPFEGHLSNEGERVVLREASGLKIDEVDYGVGFPWPAASAGDGSSMELLHPLLDNDLGGSWRASLGSRELPDTRIVLLPAADDGWRYRKGTSEASDPVSAWRAVDFIEDGSWIGGRTPIGFAGDGANTILDDMLSGYTSVYLRRPFALSAEDIPPYLKLRVYVDDGCIVWLNGVELARPHMTPGEKAFDALGRSTEARWEEFLIPGARSILAAGPNLLAVHAFNSAITNSDFTIDVELVVPARSELPPAPSPALENTVHSTTAPPQVRQVSQVAPEPRSGEPIVITAKVTDPQGVAAVSMKYQIVLPGRYIPAFLAHEPSVLMARPLDPLPPNPAFEDPANWTAAPLRDDGEAPDEAAGDGIFTGVVPPQANRTLVRWRITASDTGGSEVTVPYADDPSLNFACFVYDGVPPYQASKASVHPAGPGHIYPVEVMTSLPVYHLITRNEEIQRCVAYNGAWQIPKSNERARDAFNWEGAFIYEGQVYDHIHYRLRQANDRYGGAGKRSWRFRFNRGNYFRAKDQRGVEYPTRWRTLNTGKMVDNLRVGNFGVTETLNDDLWNRVGVAAPYMHTFHFRVVDGVDETPAGVNGQYLGDFWGMALAIEDFDPRFLEAHGLPDGNLYKLKDGVFTGNDLKRNQGRYAVTTDADFQNIRNQLRPAKDAAWLNAHVRYEKWYPYHTVVEAVRHYDFVPADSHSKNRAWYFEPAEGAPFGLLWTLPWDHDASWGPNWNSGIDYSTQAIFGSPPKPDFKRDYRNTIREFRDLVWQEEALHAMIDDLAAAIAPFTPADRDRWRAAPAEAGNQDFGTLEAKIADMKRFAFVSWSGGSGPAVGPGGRAKHLENLANAEGDATAIPATPIATYTGPAHFPADGLTFEASAFSDAQGNALAAVRWRLGEITPPGTPWNPSVARVYEYPAVWESEDLPGPQQGPITIPLTALEAGERYRVRVKMMDETGRWSHWSAPVEFTAGTPDNSVPVRDALRVSEIHYNPLEGGDLEFIELVNTGTSPIDLAGVRFTEGIEFTFPTETTLLGPGEYIVIVKSIALFDQRPDAAGVRIAGEYGGKLDNEGDEIAFQLGEGLPIQRFTYSDIWYPETDGRGPSLVIVDATASPERWSLKDGWRPSAEPHGSPGRADSLPEGLQLPGDVNQDSKLDMTDAIVLLGHLFLGSPTDLPCADGGLGLADAAADGKLDMTDAIHVLRYLFLSGSPPGLGTECVPLPGCPAACNG